MAANSIPDEPIDNGADDLLGRLNFAHTLCDLIISAPKAATLRIGVYGGWGEGKTSVLRLMQRRLRDAGHVCVFLTSWASPSTDALLELLLREIAGELDIATKLRLRKWATVVKRLTSVGRKTLSSLDARIKMADLVLGDAIEKVFGKLLDKAGEQQTEIVLNMINDELGDRKLIIFVDDLDRVRPENVPSLLLTLREALNQPNYFYVMAMAPDIVRTGLAATNEKWGNSTEFLEKIVELPRQLPRPTEAEISYFTARQLESVADEALQDTLRRLSPLLSRNPRKLKIFLRYISSIRFLLDRFAPGELNLDNFCLVQMLRVEFPEESISLMADSSALSDLEAGDMADRLRSHSSTAKKKPKPRYLSYAPANSLGSRFKVICEALRANGSMGDYYKISELFAVADNPPALTRKEFAILLASLPASPRECKAHLATFLMPGNELEHSRVVTLLNLSLACRGDAIDSAIMNAADEEVRAALEKVATYDRVIEILIQEFDIFRCALAAAGDWGSMRDAFFKWANFTFPAYHADMRERERRLLLDALDGIPVETAIGVLQILDNATIRFMLDEASRELLSRIKQSLRVQVSAYCATLLSKPGAMNGLHVFQDDILLEVFTSLSSPLYADPALRRNFLELARNAGSSVEVNQNFSRLLLAIKSYTFGSSASQESRRQLLQHKDILSAIWQAATARSLQPRFAGEIREFRQKLIALGFSEDEVPVPRWLQQMETSFFARKNELAEE